MRLDQKQLAECVWEIVRLYAKASKSGFKIEEIVLFNYLIRYRILLIIEKQCIKQKKNFMKMSDRIWYII